MISDSEEADPCSWCLGSTEEDAGRGEESRK